MYIIVLSLQPSNGVLLHLVTILRVIVEKFEIKYIAIRKTELRTTSVIFHFFNSLVAIALSETCKRNHSQKQRGR